MRYLVQYSPIGIFLSVKIAEHTKKMRQVMEYSPCYFQLVRKEGEEGGKEKCFLTLTEIRSGLSLQGTDCNCILIQGTLQRAI